MHTTIPTATPMNVPARQGPTTLDRLLALAAPAGGLLFVAGWIVLGLLRPEIGTDWGVAGGRTGAITTPVSGLGLPPNGIPLGSLQYTVFDLVFVATGLLLVAGTIGIFRVIRSDPAAPVTRLPQILLACSGVGAITCGVFTLHFVALHTLGYFLAAGVPVVSFPLLGRYVRNIPGWQGLTRPMYLAGALALVFLVAYQATFDLDTIAAQHGVAGLTSRLVVVNLMGWFAVLGGRAFRQR